MSVPQGKLHIFDSVRTQQKLIDDFYMKDIAHIVSLESLRKSSFPAQSGSLQQEMMVSGLYKNQAAGLIRKNLRRL